MWVPMSVEHLGPEAIAAFVDGELAPRAEMRARTHVAHCKGCRREVLTQWEVAATTRSTVQNENERLFASLGLIKKLTQIPERMQEKACGQEKVDSAGFGVDGRRIPRTVSDRVDRTIHRLIRRVQ